MYSHTCDPVSIATTLHSIVPDIGYFKCSPKATMHTQTRFGVASGHTSIKSEIDTVGEFGQGRARPEFLAPTERCLWRESPRAGNSPTVSIPHSIWSSLLASNILHRQRASLHQCSRQVMRWLDADGEHEPHEKHIRQPTYGRTMHEVHHTGTLISYAASALERWRSRGYEAGTAQGWAACHLPKSDSQLG